VPTALVVYRTLQQAIRGRHAALWAQSPPRQPARLGAVSEAESLSQARFDELT
jgi:hypothetical protein